MKILFVSKNKDKIEEMTNLFAGSNFIIEAISPKELYEIQSTDSDLLVRDKTLKAFEILQKPLFIEHTYLKIKSINDFPGGLTSSFWSTLQAKLICKYFGRSAAEAETIISFCDAKNIFVFKGDISGKIASIPQGKSTFQWDTIFIPDKEKLTFAQMGKVKKNKISMRKKAFEKFIKFLEEKYG